MSYPIDEKEWHICKICESNVKDLAKKYGGNGIYYSKVFERHLRNDHNIELLEYFVNICKLKRPTCKCVNPDCNKPCNVFKDGRPICWREYVCGLNAGVAEWSKNAKESRKGEGNPMYGKTPWNKDKTFSEETKNKMRLSALKRINEGRMKTTRTKPHIKVSEILSENNIKYREEETVGYWSFDFYLPDYNIYLEVDGDFYHSNPKIYPNGPECFTQRKIKSRDKQKDNFCQNNKMKLLRFWESDILYNPDNVKKKILESICKQKK